MPRKKQINIEPQALAPVEEPMEAPETPLEKPPKAERIMPMMQLAPEQPSRVHVGGFAMLFLVSALAGALVYYWPGFGMREFLSGNTFGITYTPIRHRPLNAGTSTIPAANMEKTYTSTTYNFQITYPSTATLEGDFDKDKSILIHAGGTAPDDLQLEFVSKPIVDVRGEIASTFKVVSAKDVKFNGYDAREIIVGLEDIGPARIVLISRPGGTFKIVHQLESYDTILASFKFTK